MQQRMPPVGGKLLHRLEHKPPEMHTRMRHSQFRQIYHQLIDSDNIYIDGTVYISTRRIPVRRWVETTLHSLHYVQQFERLIFGISLNHYAKIDKRVLRFKPPRRCLQHPRARHTAGQRVT